MEKKPLRCFFILIVAYIISGFLYDTVGIYIMNFMGISQHIDSIQLIALESYFESIGIRGIKEAVFSKFIGFPILLGLSYYLIKSIENYYKNY
ncbi:hypothetical protein [Pasteurella sp. 19428wF3_WM03]|uniref:hypothetical protein n=1 Tax=Pasteurella sp. 19428wF3_WM03 TaxID=2782473 RepID=UPI001073D9AA|nr:hypothetical protein E4T92_03445 [Pasteurella sp. WM03]